MAKWVDPIKWPVWVKVSPFQPVIKIDRLPIEQKRQLWEGLKASQPQVAKLLSDPQFNEFKKAFSASVVMTQAEIDTLIQSA